MRTRFSIEVSPVELKQMQVQAWTTYSACDDALENLLTLLSDTLKTLISGTLEQALERREAAQFVLRGALIEHADASFALDYFVRLQEAELTHFREEKEALKQLQIEHQSDQS